MYGPHHPLHTLAARAAVASGWPRLRVLGADEQAVQEARSAVEALLGALPQADVIVPWDEAGGEPFELRVDLPDLPLGRCLAVDARLRERGLQVEWVAGTPPGVTEADDRGLREEEWLEGGLLCARMVLDADGGGPLPLDLVRPSRVDPPLVELEGELARAVRAVDPALVLRSDRGPDTIAPVVHRTTGRFGVELALGPDAFHGLDGDAVHVRRAAVLEAVGTVVAERAEHPVLQLAPDVRWDVPLGGMSLLLWAVAPPVAGLPRDAVGEAPSAALVEGLCDDVPTLVGELEVQVVPASAAAHLSVALETAEVAEAQGWRGGRPRWVRAGGWSFVPTWRVAEPEPVQVLAAVRRLRALAGVRAVRVVPGEPSGLEEAWPTVDPAWWTGARRCWVRLHDGVRDRDHLERVEPRPRQDSDAALESAWRAGGAELGEVQPIVDRRGRPGLEARPGRSALGREALPPLLAAADALDEPHLCTVATLALPADGPVLRLWWRVPVDAGPRVWRGQAAPAPIDPV
jgi:hypothetical protein